MRRLLASIACLLACTLPFARTARADAALPGPIPSGDMPIVLIVVAIVVVVAVIALVTLKRRRNR